MDYRDTAAHGADVVSYFRWRQAQGADFRYWELVFRWYEAIRRLGLDVDFVPPGATLETYRLVLVPCLPIVPVSAERAFCGATIRITLSASPRLKCSPVSVCCLI